MNVPLIIALGGIAVIAGIIITLVSLNIDEISPVEPKNVELTGDISIGTLLPLSGDLSTQGIEIKTAIQLATDDFNDYLEKNNANWNLKIVYEDSATHPVVALEKITSLYAKDIHLVIGPSSSAELRNIMEYSNSNGMLLFSPSSTAPALAIPNDGVYRLIPDDTKQGPVISALLGYHGIEVIIEVERVDAWGEGLSASITESFKESGGTVAQTIRYDPESPEFSATTSLLAKEVNEQVAIHGAENVGVVMIGFAETLQFMQSATEHDVLDDVLWFGTDANTKEEKITDDPVGSEFANKVRFTTTQHASVDNDIRDDVESRIVQQLGRTPNTYAFSAYDIVWILGLSILDANSNDVDDLNLVISDVAAKYSGAIGNTSLNEAGDLEDSNYNVWGVRDGQWAVVGEYVQSTNLIIEY